ncbi:MAG: M6 family metalloprotease domain-containing protein [Bacteroidetes bacterium]|nr:M6 family metalloprotease domain-containing protein [Bacteroidota bacterium]
MKHFLFAIIFLVFLPFAGLRAAWLNNQPVEVNQPDGSVLHLLATGDEFFNWLHDAQMFTIIQHPEDGFYYYADLIDDELVPSDYRVGSIDPAGTHLRPGLMISAEKRTAIRQKWETEFRFAEGLRGESRAIGQFNNIVIYIRFADQAEFTTDTTVYWNMCNRNTPPDYNSMYNFFKTVSYGQLDLVSYFFPVPENNIVRSYQDIFPRSYYMPYNAATNPDGYQTDNQRTQREHTLLVNAVNWININSPVPTSINLDYNNDGRVDNVIFIVRGGTTAWSTLLWPHRWSLYTQSAFINGKRVWDYNFNLETSIQSSGVGVIAHEMYHSLGAPDLYRYTNTDLTPVGPWDVMAANNNPPQSMGAWMKRKYGGWIDNIPVITQSGVYTIEDLSNSSNNVWRVNSPNSNSEFFLLEFRRKAGTFDGTLPKSGLLIYRINLAAGNGNAQGPPDEIYIFRPGGSLSANGNLNDAVFGANYNRTEFNDFTNPNAFLQNGGPAGIYISNVSQVGPTMSFRVDFPEVPVAIPSSNVKELCLDDQVQLIDRSTGLPDTWTWQINPPNFTFLNGTNANSRFPVVKFNAPGTYTLALTVSNNLGIHNTVLENWFRVGPQAGHFEDDFETNSFTEGSWKIHNPDNGVTWQLHPVQGNGSNWAAGINFRTYFAIGQRDRLISKPFDFSNMQAAYLSFSHAYAQNAQYPNYSDSLNILYSLDCGQTWTALARYGENGSGNFATHPPTQQVFWPQTADDWCGSGFGAPCQTIDLSQLAGQPSVRLAFETVSYFGNPLLIDNVVVSQFVSTPEQSEKEALKLYFDARSRHIHIQRSTPAKANVTITDLSGRVVYAGNIAGPHASINVNLTSGTYLVHVVDGLRTESRKLLINN